jgi:RNA polymerase sigma-70 factor (ECF subfamily)
MLTHTRENQLLVDLLQRVSLHDHAAFKQLYDRTSAHLYGVAMRFMRKRELADEVLQDAYINVWQQANCYASTLSTPMTWLISVVRNKSLDRLRRHKIEFDTLVPLDDHAHDSVPDAAAGHADPQALFTAATEKLTLNRCMSLLDARQRQSLALAYYNGMSHSEVAEHLQVPLGTAKAWVRRGLARLKACFDAQPPSASGGAR